MLIFLSVVVLSCVCFACDDDLSVSIGAPLAETALLINHADAAKEPAQGRREARIVFEYQADDLAASAAYEVEPARGGWFARLCRGVRSMWSRASWKKKIVWVAVGSAVCVGAVWLNGGYYLVFKKIKDFYTYFGEGSNTSGLVSAGSGMMLYPTSPQTVSALTASAAGSVATAALTPGHRPPLPAGACDLVVEESNVERYTFAEPCVALSDGLCLVDQGCAHNGDSIYWNGSAVICRCKRVCNAPPKDLPCYGYNDTLGSADSCVPLCDKCVPAWCEVCHGWTQGAEGFVDHAPRVGAVRAWLSYYGLLQNFMIGSACPV